MEKKLSSGHAESAESPQHHTPSKMENNEVSKKVAPVPAANDNDTNEAQRIQDWDTFAESSEVKSREELRAARKEHDRKLQEMAKAGRLPPIPPTNYKQFARDTGKENRRLQKELGEEKERSQELQDQLNTALNTIDDLEQTLFNKTQELSALSPEVQLQKIKDLESRVTSLEAENRRLRNAAAEEPQVQPPRRQKEPAAIQELDDNMGIDSDEEANDFEDDEEEHGGNDEAEHSEADIGSSE
ncbi:MAG: hypothetical protein Q9195_001222 [Heterodermia aff. obscurata]